MFRFILLMGATFIVYGCHSLKNISLAKINSAQPVSETKTIISKLADDGMAGREPGTPGMEAASVWTEDVLRKAGVKPFFKNSYRDSLTLGDTPAYNIVGVMGNASNKEYILIGAHLDHIGKASSKTDSIYNGANDDAS